MHQELQQISADSGNFTTLGAAILLYYARESHNSANGLSRRLFRAFPIFFRSKINFQGVISHLHLLMENQLIKSNILMSLFEKKHYTILNKETMEILAPKSIVVSFDQAP